MNMTFGSQATLLQRVASNSPHEELYEQPPAKNNVSLGTENSTQASSKKVVNRTLYGGLSKHYSISSFKESMSKGVFSGVGLLTAK